ncbi:VacJ family lipoprotein [Marinomonas sp. TI.3.20]|uniref:MlaA family lipoprotein n=1 Tax=Marinomonas sp. TI.3.20 TaxID=3121296 RepID=UPI00311FC8BF
MRRSTTWIMAGLLSVTLSACASKSPDGAGSPEAAVPIAESSSVNADKQAAPKKAVSGEAVKDNADNAKLRADGTSSDANAGAVNSTDSTVNSADNTVATDPADPWEGFNRAMFSFNSVLDGYFLKPVAKGYKKVTPEFMQTGVSNFFSNIGEISNLTNSALQGKKNAFVGSTWRFVINSTVGVFGLFDVASSLGIRKYDEDFGQTLGYWGVSNGPYLVLPFLGPSTVRDAGGTVVDLFNYDPVDELDLNEDQNLGRWALYVVQKRASFLSAESLIIGDRYSFIRDVYLQTRQNEVYDGHPPQSSAKDKSDSEDSWGDESSDDTDSWGDEDGTDSWGDTDSSDTTQPAADSTANVTLPASKKTSTDNSVKTDRAGTDVIKSNDDAASKSLPSSDAALSVQSATAK